MKIAYLLLENYIGIHDGLNQSKIEIDFSKNDKRIILLLGKNGSGKSTILSTLHPYSETFDSRSTLIVPGKEGYKEIHIQKDSDMYFIRHFYGKKNKSFIAKNDIENELNKNGGIRTFEDIVEQELGVTKDFFKLNKVSSTTTNFVDMNSSSRKQFIGKFMPNIDEYLSAFQIVNGKINVQNKEIKFINEEVSKLGDKDIILQEISSESKDLNLVNKLLIKVSSEELSLRNRITEEEEELSNNQELIDEYNELSKSKVEVENSLNSYIEKYPNSFKDKSVNDINTDLNDFKSRKATVEKTLISTNLQKSKLEEAVNHVLLETSSLSSEEKQYASFANENIETLNQNLKKRENKLASLLDKKKGLLEVIDDDYSSDKFSLQDFSNNTNILSNIVHSISANWKDITQNSEYDMFSSMFNDSGTGTESVAELHKTLTRRAKLLKENKSSLKKEIVDLKDQKLTEEVSSEIVALCKDKTCGVYKRNKAFKDVSANLTEKENQLTKVSDELEACEESLTLATSFVDDMSDIKGAFEALKKNKFFLSFEKFQVIAEMTFDEFMTVLFNELTTSTLIENYFNVDNEFYLLQVNIEIKNEEEQIVSAKSRIKSLSETEDLLKSFKERKILNVTKRNELTPKLQEVSTFSDELTNEVSKLVKKITVFETVKDIHQQYETLDKNLKVFEKSFTAIKNRMAKLEEMKASFKSVSESVESQKKLVETQTAKLDSLKMKKIRFDEFDERKNKVIEKRKIYQYIRDAVDMKTGIPLILLGSYVEDIKINTNNLLSKAFKNDFVVSFKITDSEFSIPVFKNNSIADDILECSGGQQALVKTALSLGIITQAIKTSSKGYNIIYLDEIDAELDTTNRRAFINILNTQLDILNNEQCFVITHNDGFTQADVGLVLLPGAAVDTDDSDFMQNKDIIADFR